MLNMTPQKPLSGGAPPVRAWYGKRVRDGTGVEYGPPHTLWGPPRYYPWLIGRKAESITTDPCGIRCGRSASEESEAVWPFDGKFPF